MPSGYEESDDYGCPEPHKHLVLIALLIFVAFCALVGAGAPLGIARRLWG